MNFLSFRIYCGIKHSIYVRPAKTMFILLKSEKWALYRDYCFEVHGTKATTMVFGLLTVLMMPGLLWIMRRAENAIQSVFRVRTLATFRLTDNANRQLNQFLESIVVIYQQCELPCYPKGLKHKLKVLCGLMLSKTYVFVVFGLIIGLDQIRSDRFRCRNLKDGAEFLLSNDTQPANYLNKTFTEIFEMRKENGKNVLWGSDIVNGLLSDYLKMMADDFDCKKVQQKFSQTTDLIQSFNLDGFHEVCNVLNWPELTQLYHLPPWFGSRNATGKFYKTRIKHIL